MPDVRFAIGEQVQIISPEYAGMIGQIVAWSDERYTVRLGSYVLHLDTTTMVPEPSTLVFEALEELDDLAVAGVAISPYVHARLRAFVAALSEAPR